MQNLYEKRKSSVIINVNLSDSFPCRTGVRQGDNLSPLLFAIYLHDLEQFIRYRYNGLNLLSEIQNQNNLPDEMENYIKKIVLIYADDTILLAKSEEDLKDALSAMFNYCNKWKLQVNVKQIKNCSFLNRKNQENSKCILRSKITRCSLDY